MGRTCCQGTEVLVTEGDRVRIRAFTGRDDFWADDWPRDPAYCDDGSDPGWVRAFHVDGSRPVLNHRPGTLDCTFLGPQGCTLPYDVRPLVCRLFPYAYDEHGVDPTPMSLCPPEVIPPGSTALEMLDMRLDLAQQWHAQLYAEIAAHPGRGRR
jgi:Fe-S-cluster containining protein